MTVDNLILENLREQRQSGSFCDVKLSVGKQYTWAHSAVVCPLSDLISNQYNSPKHNKIGTLKKNNMYSSIKVKLGGKVDCDCFECLEKLIDFIYGIKPILSKDHSSHVLSYCQLLKLSKRLLQIINNSLENVNLDVIYDDNLIKSEPVDNIDCKLSESDVHSSNDYDNSDKEDNYPKIQLKDDSYIRLPTGKTQNCIGCNFKCYKSIDLLSHLRETGHGGNICSLCWTELDNSNDLKEHFILHEHPKPFFCTYCDLRFQTRSLLGQHLPRHMFEKPFVCPHCQKAFKRKHGLNCHLITHSNERKHLCDECGFSTTHARILRAHKLVHSGDLFKCTFPGCAHTSTRKENMKQHYSTHSNEKHFVCELCGHKFTQSKSLRRHMLIHNNGELDNICPHCPFKARRLDNLKAHIMRQHTDKFKTQTKCFPEAITIEPDVKNIIEPPGNLNNTVPPAKRLKLQSYIQQ